jgi:hypothetical protein
VEDLLVRVWENLAGRVGGPMTLRLILQPTIAALMAFRGGMKDARDGRPAYFWTVLVDPLQRTELIREGWKAIAKVFCMAVIIDVIYQWIVQRWVYPGESLIVAILLAVVPYLLIRGPVNRVVRRWHGRAGQVH